MSSVSPRRPNRHRILIRIMVKVTALLVALAGVIIALESLIETIDSIIKGL
jgi:hypothetical protein